MERSPRDLLALRGCGSLAQRELELRVSLIKTQQLEVAVMLHFGRTEPRLGGSRRRGSSV